MDFNFNIPEIRSPIHDFGGPPHKLPLSEKDRERVEAAMERLSQSNLHVQLLFDLFQDWQSRRTLLVKRLLMSTSVIVGGVLWVGMDLSKFSFLGVTVGDGSLGRFILFLVGFIVISGLFFEFSRRIDKAVQRANISRIRNDLTQLAPIVAQLDEISSRYGIDSVDDLLDDCRERFSTDYSDIKVYDAIKFYQHHLKTSGAGLSLIEGIELIGVYVLAGYALYGLGRVLFG